MSDTGQPGLPPLDGGVYTGPQPWRWVDGLPAQDVVARLRDNLDGRIAVIEDGDIVTLGGQLSVHRQRLDELARSGQLDKVLLMVHNLAAGMPWDPDEQIAKDLAGSHRGQERLRFTGQLEQVTSALAEWGVAEHPLFRGLSLSDRVRLLDVVAAGVEPSHARAAAAFAADGASTVDAFVQRMEYYLASRERGLEPADVPGALAQRVEQVQGILVSTAQVAPDAHDLAGEVKEHAAQLGFATALAAAYHLQKHGGGDAEQYLASARDAIRNPSAVEISTELDGSRSIVFWRGSEKAVVRVAADGSANLLTYFTKGA